MYMYMIMVYLLYIILVSGKPRTRVSFTRRGRGIFDRVIQNIWAIHNLQDIINHPPYGDPPMVPRVSLTRCYYNFKKRFHCVTVVLFSAELCYGDELTVHLI